MAQWMDVDTALASFPVNIMPLVDSTDFTTIEAAVVYNQAGLSLFWNFETTAGVKTVTAVTPTTGGVYDWTDFTTSGMYGIEMPASGGASANNDTEGFGYFTGVATGILPWRGPKIGFRAAALNNALIDGGDTLDVNVTTVSDTAQTANDNGADINTLLTRIIGTLATGTHNPATAAQIAVLSDWINGGRLDLILDIIAADVINIDGAAMRGTDGANTTVPDAAGVVPTALENADAVWDEILTGATHNIATSAGRRLRGIQENGSVYNGEVHVDTNNGVTGVVPYENGTSDNSTLTWAEALVIAPLVNGGLSDFHLINGSSITFTSSMANKSLFGDNYTVALGGQNCADVFIQGASVSGAGTAATGEMHFDGCNFGVASIQSGHFDFCAFADTITHTLAGNYKYHNSYSDEAGGGSSTFTKTLGQTITSQWRNWAGSIIVSNIESGDVMTIGGTLGTVTLNGANGTVEIRGSYKSIVDNRTGSPALNLDGAVQSDDLVDLVWDEIISKAAHDVANSAAKILRQGGDIVQIDGAVSDAGATTLDFDTNLAGYVDTYFDDAILVFTNGSANAGIGKPISAFIGTGGNCAFDSPDDWPVTPVNGDDFVIYAIHVHPVSQISAQVMTDLDANGSTVIDELTTQGDTNETKLDTLTTNVADVPTVAEFEVRTPTAAQLAYMVENSATAKPVTFSGTGTTTSGTMALVDGVTPNSNNDQYTGRLLVFNAGTLDEVVTDILTYTGATGVFTCTAVTFAITSSHTARLT